jgi:hypothetical protein
MPGRCSGLKEGIDKFNEQLIFGEPSLAPKVCRLAAGGEWIRTSGPARTDRALKPYRQRELLLTTDTESSRDPPLEGDSFEPLDLRQKLT